MSPVSIAGTDHTAVIEHAQQLLDTVEGADVPAGLEVMVAGPATLENEVIGLAEEDSGPGRNVRRPCCSRGSGSGLRCSCCRIDSRSCHGHRLRSRLPSGSSALVGMAVDFSFFVTKHDHDDRVLRSASTIRCSSCLATGRSAQRDSRRWMRSGHRRHRKSRRALLRYDGGSGTARNAAHADDDLPQFGSRRHRCRASSRCSHRSRPSCTARPARRPHQLAEHHAPRKADLGPPAELAPFLECNHPAA